MLPVRRRSRIFLMLCLLSTLAAVASAQSTLTKYDTRYYMLYTDLDDEAVREIKHRIDFMAEAYNERLQGVGTGAVTRRLPFYLFSRAEDYLRAGGAVGTAGVFMRAANGDAKLMAIAPKGDPEFSWHVIQHEGFHQFVDAVIGGDVPVWVNEGLAEYFGHARFTGDGYITGVIPGERLRRLKLLLQQESIRPLEVMMQILPRDWNAELSILNYDQAWSMVHFLAHGDNGRYAAPFTSFLRDVSSGKRREQAWKDNFGGVKDFQTRWEKYWREMPSTATQELETRALVTTMTSYYGRAFSQRQKFESGEAFLAAAKAGALKAHKSDWLPPQLLERTLKALGDKGTWKLDPRKPRELVYELDERRYVGTFEIANNRIKPSTVKVRVIAAPSAKKKPSP